MDALPTPPAAPEPALQTAARLLAEGRPADAVARLAALVAEAPAYAAAHVLHATALEAAGRTDDALEAWGHAALLVPRSPLVRRERARLAALAALSAPDVALPAGEPDATSAEATTVSFEDPAPEPVNESPEAADSAAASAFPPDSPGDASADLDVEPDLLPFHEYHPGATSTPFFSDDDEPADEPAGERPGDPADGPSAVGPDWGDLPPLAAPVLPPEPPPASAAPPPRAEDETDWRIVEEGADEPPLPAFEEAFQDAFETPAAPADDLDALISQLEQAPRIRPDPTFSGPAVTVDESGVDEMVSETLAKIYAAQHRYVEAAVMYEKLAAREPAQADELLRRAAELRDRR